MIEVLKQILLVLFLCFVVITTILGLLAIGYGLVTMIRVIIHDIRYRNWWNR